MWLQYLQVSCDGVFSDDLGSGLSGQYQHFLSITIDVKLPRAHHRSQFWVILHCQPKTVVHAILLKQLSLQVRAHVGGINCHQSSIF